MKSKEELAREYGFGEFTRPMEILSGQTENFEKAIRFHIRRVVEDAFVAGYSTANSTLIPEKDWYLYVIKEMSDTLRMCYNALNNLSVFSTEEELEAVRRNETCLDRCIKRNREHADKILNSNIDSIDLIPEEKAVEAHRDCCMWRRPYNGVRKKGYRFSCDNIDVRSYECNDDCEYMKEFLQTLKG